MAITNKVDILDPSIVERIITEMNKSEDRDRRTHSFDSWKSYSGDIEDYVVRRLQVTRPKSWSGMTFSNVALSKIIVDKIAKAYKDQPHRHVTEDESKVKTDAYKNILKQADARDQLPFLDVVTTLHKYGLIWVNYREDESRYQFMTLQGHEFAVVRSKDTGRLEAVILNYAGTEITDNGYAAFSRNGDGDGLDDLIAESQNDSSAGSEVYAMWTAENHVVVQVQKDRQMMANGEKTKISVTYIENPDNPDNVNRLGVLPFVFYSAELSPDYPTPSPLFEQTVSFNQQMSEYLSAANLQGTGQLVLSYPESMEGMFKKITRGLLSAIKMPQSSNPNDRPTDVKYINPSPDLGGQKDAVMTYMQSVMKEHGITAGSSVDMENFSSGLERAIANANVDDIIMKKQEQMVEIEKQIFNIIKAYEREIFNRPTFSDEDQLMVIFKKPKVMMSDTEVLTNIEKKMALGLMSRADALMVLDPNLDSEEAEEKLQMIDQESLNIVRNIGNTGQSNQENNS